MENEFFVNAGIPPPLQFGQSLSSPMPAWQSIASAMEIQGTEMNCSPDQSQDCFLNPNSADYGLQFESALSSMVSSPAASNSNISNESFMIRELIGKLGSIGNGGEISPHSQPLLASYINGNNSANTSCYNTPLNSPPKLSLPVMDGLVKEKLPSLGLNSSVAEFAADPGFAERAAKFSCFGSKSFNDRTTQFGLNNNTETAGGYRSNSLSRVSSSPSLKAMGSQPTNNNSPLQELANSQEESIVSEQNPNQNVESVKAFKESNPRKRKAVSKAKSKEKSSAKDSEPNEKRCKSTESQGKENGSVKAEEEAKGSNGNAEDEKQNKTENKSPEPPKDYIHVRARRGQATDSHSLAERVRREKISERMKLLQNLVPGCNKVTGKALMLDEIINYVQSLQRQVEFLSMKLASVNTRLDFNTASTSMSKDIFQSNTLPHPIDSSASAFYGHQNPALHGNISNGTMTQCSVEPLDTAICTKLNTHLPPTINHFTHTIPQPQYPTFCEGDLQTIVQMGFAQTTSQDIALGSQSFHHRNKE